MYRHRQRRLGDSAYNEFDIGDRIEIRIGPKSFHWGSIEFIGRLTHLRGADHRMYFGVELDEKLGDNNGCVGATQYFSCADGYGLFVLARDVSAVVKQEMRVFVGEDVEVNGFGKGSVRWIGYFKGDRLRNRLRFGIELRQPRGAHEGVHGGVRYFRCARRCAVFCGAEDILSVTVAQSKGMVGDRVLVRGFGEGVIRFIGDSAEQRGYLKYGIESLAPRARKRFVFVDRAKIAKVLQKCAAKHRRYDVVEVDGYGMGVVRFIGTIPEIPDDVSYGVDLDRAVGKNNGSLNGRRYFETPNADRTKHHGIFVTERFITRNLGNRDELKCEETTKEEKESEVATLKVNCSTH